MAATKRRLFAAFRFSRKLVLIAGGALLTLGASGTAALVMTGPGHLIPGFGKEKEGSCKTVHHAKFKRIDETRIVTVIQTSDKEPEKRIGVGLRLARHIAASEKPDLVTVQMTDVNGPIERTKLRGEAIGTEIVYAPNPNRTRATNQVWEVRYVDTLPTELGLFFGPRIDMDEAEIERLDAAIPAVEGCDGDTLEERVAIARGVTRAKGHPEAKTATAHH